MLTRTIILTAVAIAVFGQNANATQKPVNQPNTVKTATIKIPTNAAPSEYLCDGIDIDAKYVKQADYSPKIQGIWLEDPKRPNFKHFAKCNNLIKVYG